MEFFTSSFLPLPLAHMQHPGFAQPSGTWSRSQSSLPCSAEPKHHLPDPKLNKLHFANTVTCLSNITWNAVKTKEFPPLPAADRRPFSGQSTSNNTSRSCYRASWSKDSAAGTAILHGSASTCSVIKCHAFTRCCDTVHCS